MSESLSAPFSEQLPCEVAAPSRLAVIAALALRGRLGDPGLDAVVATVAAACETPIAVINIVTPGRQTYPAAVGLDVPSTNVPDALSFCAEVVATGLRLTVEDARAHPVYADNPLVQAGSVVAYAGEPLVHAGYVIGSLSVLDSTPRTFTSAQLRVLQAQARVASALIQLRVLSASRVPPAPLPRDVLLGRAARAIADSAPDAVVGMVVLDVVDMKEVNEALTSAGGDRVLDVLGERLQDACQPGESAASVGGDEFALLLGPVASDGQAEQRAAAVAAAVAGPVAVGDAVAAIALRVGQATVTDDTADALLAAAERSAVDSTALDGLTSSQVRTHQLETAELRAAIDEGQLVLHYQPVVDLQSERMTGVEALVRWQHPVRGLVPPLDFIPLAEESGLIVDLGDWVLRAAAEQAAAWQRAGRPRDVAVNLSPRQMSDPDFAEYVMSVLASAGAPVERVVLEVTESALLDQAHAASTLRALREQGVRLALDDFGTGYASFSYLRRFPIDILKIDRSFVLGLGRHADDEAIVASVVALARNTGKTVVAEGVERRDQASLLRALGVECGQGFLWSKALPAAQVETWQADRSAADDPTGSAHPEDVEARETFELSPRAVILGMHEAGASVDTIAAALNAHGRRAPGGKRWHGRSVAAVLASREVARGRR